MFVQPAVAPLLLLLLFSLFRWQPSCLLTKHVHDGVAEAQGGHLPKKIVYSYYNYNLVKVSYHIKRKPISISNSRLLSLDLAEGWYSRAHSAHAGLHIP